MDYIKFHSETMTLNNSDVVPYLTYNALSKIDFITHGFSTRLGGVSTGDFTSMNLALNRGDNRESVLENYKRLSTAIGVDYNTLVASAQDHNTVVRCVSHEQYGVGITKPRDMDSVDALVTDEPNVTLVTYYADCTPIFYVDTVKKVIALAHGGWRGTVNRIAQKVVATMVDKYDCNTANITAAIGPAISRCCYEVDYSCAKEFMSLEDVDTEKIITPKEKGKYMLDLLEANRQLLIGAGVLNDNIIVSDVCTRCNNQLLWSHRATNGHRGTMAAMMSINKS